MVYLKNAKGAAEPSPRETRSVEPWSAEVQSAVSSGETTGQWKPSLDEQSAES